MKDQDVLLRLKSLSNPQYKDGMAKFGINTDHALGVSLYVLRPLAKEIGKDHDLAKELWTSGLHEARILASMLAEPDKVTEGLMEAWSTILPHGISMTKSVVISLMEHDLPIIKLLSGVSETKNL